MGEWRTNTTHRNISAGERGAARGLRCKGYNYARMPGTLGRMDERNTEHKSYGGGAVVS